MLATKLRNGSPVLSFLQNPYDLDVGVSCLLHKISVDKSTAKILLSHPLIKWGDYHLTTWKRDMPDLSGVAFAGIYK